MFSRLPAKIIILCLLITSAPYALGAEPFWIDVRSAAEYSEGHVEQAVNIPHQEIAEQIVAVTAEKDAEIYVYCRSGRRSGIAKETLENLGYTAVVNVGGLDDALERSGQASPH